jgi:hypothetical protein
LTEDASSVMQLATSSWESFKAEFGVANPELLIFLDAEASAIAARLQEEVTTGLEEIDPPEFAVSWHQYQIDESRMLSQLFIDGAYGNGTLNAVVASWEGLDALSREEYPAWVHATSRCPAFEAAWIEIALVDGGWETPDDGLDYATCAGLADYEADLGLAAVTALAKNPDLVQPFLNFDAADDPWALPEADVLAVAELMDVTAREEDTIVPPDYAVAFHEAREMEFLYTAAVIRETVANGAAAAEQTLADERAALVAAYEAAIEEAAQGCAIFPEYAANQ